MAVAALIAAVTTACTQGVAADIPDGGRLPEIETAPVSSGVAPTSVVQTTAPTLTAPPVASTTTQPTSADTVVMSPPTIAQEFASALAPVEVSVLGAPVSVTARDSVARLWLLVGRPPTADELRTAVTAAVRDGVPLDAIATLLLNTSAGAVAPPDVSPDEFVADLYEGVLAWHGKPDEVSAWVRGLRDGMSAGEVAVEFAESPEAVRRTGTVAHESLDAVAVEDVPRAVSDSVLRLYLGLLVRLPSADELDRDVDRYARRRATRGDCRRPAPVGRISRPTTKLGCGLGAGRPVRRHPG